MAYRILAVDDDDDIRRFVRLALSPTYEVVEAADGLEALNKLDLFEPDLAILDLEMPAMNGIALCRAIRRHGRFARIPILFLSGRKEAELIKTSYASGGNLFIPKPVEPERLLRNVELTIRQERIAAAPKSYSLDDLRQIDDRMAGVEDAPRPDARASVAESAAGPAKLGRPAAPAASPSPARAPSPAAPAVKPRVLAIDDDEDMLKLFSLALSPAFEVAFARNGMDAIEKIVRYQPDMVLCDIMMPRMNGLQFLQVVRRNADYKSLPIVVVSGKTTDRDRSRALQLGATDFLAKPFEPETLLDRLTARASHPSFRVKPKRTSWEAVREEMAEEAEALRRRAPVAKEIGFQAELEALVREETERRR